MRRVSTFRIKQSKEGCHDAFAYSNPTEEASSALIELISDNEELSANFTVDFRASNAVTNHSPPRYSCGSIVALNSRGAILEERSGERYSLNSESRDRFYFSNRLFLIHRVVSEQRAFFYSALPGRKRGGHLS